MPLPTPQKGEEQNDFISRCIRFVKKEDPQTPNNQATAMCFTQWRKNKEMSKHEKLGRIEFSIPIQESLVQEITTQGTKEFFINGIAINATTTRNGITYIAEELAKSASTLKNKPILKDHINSVDHIVGRTTENTYFDSTNNNIKFEAKIMDEEIKQKIKDGRITSVSVGATVEDLQKIEATESIPEQIVAKGIDFVELSLVAVPADPNAGIAQALQEMYERQNTEKTSPFSIVTSPQIKTLTEETTTNTQEKPAQEQSQNQKTIKEESLMAEEKAELQMLKEENAKLQVEIEKIKLERLQQEKDVLLKEQEKTKEAKKEVIIQDKTQGEVTSEAETKITEKYIVSHSDTGMGIALTASYDGYGDLKRLRRSVD